LTQAPELERRGSGDCAGVRRERPRPTAKRKPVSRARRRTAAELLVSLAEVYDGEHGLAYASGALEAEPGTTAPSTVLTTTRGFSDATIKSRPSTSRHDATLGDRRVEARESLAASYDVAGDLDRQSRSSSPCVATGGVAVAQKARRPLRTWGRTARVDEIATSETCPVDCQPALLLQLRRAPDRPLPFPEPIRESEGEIGCRICWKRARAWSAKASGPRRSRNTERSSKAIPPIPKRFRGSRSICGASATTRSFATCSGRQRAP